MCAATGFHDDERDAGGMETALELGAGEAGSANHFPIPIGIGQLEDALCQINGTGCSIHDGRLLVAADIHTT
jgi:hypothetical protein